MNKLTKRLFSAGCSLLLLGTAITPAYPVLAETEESAAEAQTEDSAADTEESAAEAQTEDSAADTEEPTAAQTKEDTAETFTEKGLIFQETPGGLSVVGAESDSAVLSIPQTAGGKKVSAIGENAFSGKALKEVTIADGVQEIGAGAFSQCTSLEKISIPDSVRSIGNGAFYFCMSLQSAELPDSVTELGDSVFENCYGLLSVRLSNKLKTLPMRTFYYAIGLQELTIPEGVETISDMAVVNCISLRTIHLPATLSTFSSFAMLSCMGLETIDLASGNKNYLVDENGVLLSKDRKRLMLYPAAKEDTSYTVPEGIDTIQPYAFSGAVKLEKLQMAASVTTLADGAFAECRNLKSFEIPSHVTKINPSLFINCESLESVTIPVGVTEIGANAFYSTGLKDISIPATVTKVGESAFFNCKNLKTLYLPETAETIGNYAFGYEMPEDENAKQPVIMADFVLQGKPDSPAQNYAKLTGAAFKQRGLSIQAILAIIVGAAAVLMVAVSSVVKRKRAKTQAASPEKAAEPEITDPNYNSILAGDDGNAEGASAEEQTKPDAAAPDNMNEKENQDADS